MQEERQIISTKEARKILGKELSSLSDAEVEALIVDVELMAEITIKRIKKDRVVPKST